MATAREVAVSDIKDRFRSIAGTASDAHKNIDDIESLGADVEEIEADLRAIVLAMEKLS